MEVTLVPFPFRSFSFSFSFIFYFLFFHSFPFICFSFLFFSFRFFSFLFYSVFYFSFLLWIWTNWQSLVTVLKMNSKSYHHLWKSKIENWMMIKLNCLLHRPKMLETRSKIRILKLALQPSLLLLMYRIYEFILIHCQWRTKSERYTNQVTSKSGSKQHKKTPF